MKEIQTQFALTKLKNPSWGDYICLCHVIKGRGHSDSIIEKAFDKFVLDCPKYGKKEKKMYIDYLKLKTLRK